MASVYSKDIQVYTAENFIKSFNGSNVYLTFGHQSPWTNDLNPDQANTSVESYYDTWRYMIGGKLITGNDLRHVIPRIDWTSNTTYIAYDQNQNSLTKNESTGYYVVTDVFNIYKCIANNNGQPSTSKPTSTNPGVVFQTADKYFWKYMYTLTADEKQKFLTDDFIPVKTLESDDNSLQWQVQQDAVPGSINSVIITNTGGEYLYQNAISVTITGDGRFANAYALVNNSTRKIESIIVDNFGSNYTYANVDIKAPVGTRIGANATARVIISPPGGHGSDPLYELGGSYVMINTFLNGNEGGILDAKNDYRQISILEGPLVYGTSNAMTNLAFSQATVITLSQSTSLTDYLQDEIVYQGPNLGNASFTASVISWDYANSILKLNNVQGVPISQPLIGYTSTATRYVSSVKNPDCKPNYGRILYKDNISAIQRNNDQNENFKIVLSF